MMLFRIDINVVVPEFFACVLNSNFTLSRVKRLIAGAAAPHLNIRDIRRFPIPLPPIREQREIAAQLSELTQKTTDLQLVYTRKIEAHNALKKSLLHHAVSGNL